jgi:ornithine cyclodeaminase/alanine dehydrogenase-like protein (mu-crystallin family)
VALLDSLVVTIMRTAAVTAIAVRHLAPGSRSALLVGAGTQAEMQIAALQLGAQIETLAVYDLATDKAEVLVEKARTRGIDARVVTDVERAAAESDVVVTVTPARSPILNKAPKGALVVALGADEPGKRELGPDVLTEAKVVVDVLEQAAYAGELSSAIGDGSITREDVYAELGEIVAGVKPGHTSADETFVFDATGTAMQDVAASLLLIGAARREGRGTELDLDH